jgi:hypothetical protein
MFDFTRYAIIIEIPTDGTHAPLKIGGLEVYQMWHCQGLPNDPTNFGFAILYNSYAAAEKAIKTGRGYIAIPGCARIVPVTCKVDL